MALGKSPTSKEVSDTSENGNTNVNTNLFSTPDNALGNSAGTDSSVPVTALSSWTRGQTLRSVERDEEEITTSYGIIQPEDRHLLAPKDKLRHQEVIIKGLPNKFQLLVDFDPDAPMDALKNVYSVKNLISALKRSFASNGMLSEFLVPSCMDLVPHSTFRKYIPSLSATKLNLFHHYGKVELSTIR